MAALFLLLAAALAYSPLHSRTPGEIVFHEFQGTGGLAVDARGNHSLILSSGIMWNTDRTGLNFSSTHSGTISQNNWADLHSAINNSRSWTFEFWVKQVRALSSNEVTLGGFHSENATIIPTAGNIQDGFPVPGNTTWAAFGVFNRAPNDSMFLSYSMDGGNSSLQSTYTTRGRITNVISHLVYVVEQVPNNRVRFFQNGINVRNITRVLDFVWDTPDWYYFLKIAPHLVDPIDGSSSDFEGDMYLFALYDKALTSTEVVANYMTRIPNSNPVAYNTVVNGTEDAINSFSVSAYDYDEVSFDHENVTCSIVALPTRGSLIKPDNSTATSPFSFLHTDVFSFVNQQGSQSQSGVTFGSPYTTFTFKCVDGSGATSNTATVTINIIHVNHAPVAANSTISIDRTATLLNIAPNITDYDGPLDLTAKGTIAEYAMYGTLQNYNGTNITTAPWNLTFYASRDALTFIYSPAPNYGVAGQAIVYTDVVAFYVTDNPGVFTPKVLPKQSNVAYMTINVRNNIIITKSGGTVGTVSGLQDNTTLFMLPGIDITGQPLDAFVLDIPTMGKLFLPDGTEITSAGPFPYPAGVDPNNASSNGVYLRYQPPPLFFGNVTFGYYLQSRIDGWKSANATLLFQVLYVNQPPTVTTNTTSINISRTNTMQVNFSMMDLDPQGSVQYSYRFRTSFVPNNDKNGTLYVGSNCNCSNITGNPIIPANSPTANGTYAAIQQALSSMTILGQNEGEGILTLYVFDYNVKLSSGIKANASVSITFRVTEPSMNPPKKLGQLEQILVYVGISVGGGGCIFCCCFYCYWSNKKQKKKYYEQGYAAEASAMSMDRL